MDTSNHSSRNNSLANILNNRDADTDAEADNHTMPTPIRHNSDSSASSTSSRPERKYTCSYPDCEKAFTTSGHLARHNRIHTGEKNFKCPYLNCNSRFSRQDNMMQHYRTHISSKSRRPIKSRRGYDSQINARSQPYSSAHPYYIPSAPVQPQSTYISMPTYSSYPQYGYTYQTYSQPLPSISPVLQRLDSPTSPLNYTHQKKQSVDGLDTLANAALV